MNKNRFFLLLLLIAFGCSNSENSKSISFSPAFKNRIKITNTNATFSWNDKVDSINVIQLNNNSAGLLSTIDKGLFYKDMFYFLDIKSRRLIRFDLEGKFRGMVGMVGTGKGQYLEARDFAIENDTIYILDYKKIHAYSVFNNNKYIKDIEFSLDAKSGQNPSKFVFFNEDNILLWTSSPDVVQKDQGVFYRLQHLQGGKATDKFFKYDHDIFDKDRFSKAGSNEYYLIPPDGSYDIYQVKNDAISGFMKLDFGVDSLPPAYNNDNYDVRKLNDYLRNKYFKSINVIRKISDKLYYFDCLGNAGYTYEGIIDIRKQNADFGRLEVPYSPRIFYSDKDFVYGYYNASFIANFTKDKTNNVVFETLKKKLTSVNADNNLIIVKMAIKKSMK